MAQIRSSSWRRLRLRPGCSVRALKSSYSVRLSSTADVLGVGVHEPRHLPLTGRRVRSGDVLIGPDHRHQLTGETAGDPLHLSGRQAVGITAHPTLGTTERQAQERALEAHPERQRRALAERNAGGLADSPLGRPQREGVLDPVARQALDLTAVAADGKLATTARRGSSSRARASASRSSRLAARLNWVTATLHSSERHSPPGRRGRPRYRERCPSHRCHGAPSLLMALPAVAQARRASASSKLSRRASATRGSK